MEKEIKFDERELVTILLERYHKLLIQNENSDELLNFVIDLVDTMYYNKPFFSIPDVVDYINKDLLTKHSIKITGDNKKIQIIKKNQNDISNKNNAGAT